MYDLEIIVPAELNSERIAQRLVDFRKWGLQNADTAKLKIHFIASRGNPPEKVADLCSGWPSNFDVEGTICPYTHVAQRIMYYYSEIMQPNIARWYMRIDEDTMTDIGGLLKNLDSWFDYQRDYHITGEVSRGIENIEYRLLKEVGFGHWYDHVKDYNYDPTAPVHGIETTITSNSAIEKILANPSSKQLLTLRKEFGEAQGDHTFCWAARIAKIYPLCVKFLTRDADFVNYSGFGGYRNHIHDISRERSRVFPWMELASGTNDQLEEEISSVNYFLRWKQRSEAIWITLQKNKRIEILKKQISPFRNEVIGIWGITANGDLTVFFKDHELHRSPDAWAPITFKKSAFGFEAPDSFRQFQLKRTSPINPTSMKIL